MPSARPRRSSCPATPPSSTAPGSTVVMLLHMVGGGVAVTWRSSERCLRGQLRLRGHERQLTFIPFTSSTMIGLGALELNGLWSSMGASTDVSTVLLRDASKSRLVSVSRAETGSVIRSPFDDVAVGRSISQNLRLNGRVDEWTNERMHGGMMDERACVTQ